MDLHALHQSLNQAFLNDPYVPCDVRCKNLLKIKKLLLENSTLIAEAVSKDFSHRSIHETLLLEYTPCISAVDYCIKNLKKWTKKRKRHVPWYNIGSTAYVFPQPLGVVGVIVPWNYPILLAIGPLIYALAAGNQVMIKMSELSPHLGKVLKKLFDKANLVRQKALIVNGDIEVSKEFASIPFNHILFTGSINVGKLVMEAASKNLTPVTLELGGKSPVILSPTMHINFFEHIFMGKLFNGGQTCLASDYLMIPKGWEKKVEEQFGQCMQKFYPNFPETDDYTSIISENRKKHLEDLLADARKKGARIVQFGKDTKQKQKMPAYLIFNANHTMQVMQEEIFGPLLPIITYKSIKEAIQTINAGPHPLAIYYFGENKKDIETILTQTLSGTYAINCTVIQLGVDDLPFGGVGYSGMGQYHAEEGFNTFSKLRPVFSQCRFSLLKKFIYPPYGRNARLFLSKILGVKNNNLY